MPEDADPLACTKPLADPLRILARVMLGLALAAILAGVVFLIITHGVGGWPLFGAACTIHGCVLFFAVPFGRPNAIYLRAFRTDRQTAALRAQLIAGLGPEFRLSGIRPPRKHSSVFLRFLLPGIFAFRYGGSKFMELEGGDDWMARLWKTYQTTRIVFIDIRDVTLYVHQEIRMTLASVGAQRCLFLIDRQKDLAAWREILAEIAGPQHDTNGLSMLDVSSVAISSGQMQTELNRFVRQLPAGTPGKTVAGHDFILQHVSADILLQSRRPSFAAIAGAVVGAALCLSSGLLLNPHVPEAIHAILSILGIFVAIPLLFILIFRSLARGFRLMRAHHAFAGLRACFGLAGGFFLIILGPGLSAIQPIMQQYHDHPEEFRSHTPPIPHETGEEAEAMNDVRAIYHAELSYYIKFHDSQHGTTFACTLNDLGGTPKPNQSPREATPQAAQLLEDTFFTNNEEHYNFAVACVDDAGNFNPSGTHFRILATSNRTGRKHGRSICSQGSADDIPNASPGEFLTWQEHPILRYDPSGGSNCTEIVDWDQSPSQ